MEINNVPMERPLTDTELAEIERRLARITPRPWMRNGKTAAGWRIDDSDPNRLGMAFLLTPTALVPHDGNAEFIERAPDDVAALLAEIRRLRAAAAPGTTV